MQADTDPVSAPGAPLRAADGLELTWQRAIKIWWSIVWRAGLFGALTGTVVETATGALAAAGVPAERVGRVGHWVTLAMLAPIGVWTIRNTFRRSWSDFRIALLPPERHDG
jgi:hypothetical protein